MKLYQITVQYVRVLSDGSRLSGGLPTFYLRDDMQGIVSEDHTKAIAGHLLHETAASGMSFHIGVAVSRDFDPAAIGA
jgi:hypothetical protein